MIHEKKSPKIAFSLLYRSMSSLLLKSATVRCILPSTLIKSLNRIKSLEKYLVALIVSCQERVLSVLDILDFTYYIL